MRKAVILFGAAAVAGAALSAALLAQGQGGQGVSSKDVLDGFANPARWLTNAGDYTGQRHSPLKQITPANASQLAPQWTFQTGGVTGQFEATPIVIDGVMYVTGPRNHAWALDAKTGKEIWHHQRTLPTEGLKVCCGPVNRGFAIQGSRLFMTTLDAHLEALDIKTGKVVWDVELADYKKGYASTVAPLLVKDNIDTGDRMLTTAPTFGWTLDSPARRNPSSSRRLSTGLTRELAQPLQAVFDQRHSVGAIAHGRQSLEAAVQALADSA